MTYEDMYKDMLEETSAKKDMSPTDYRCGFNDWLNGIEESVQDCGCGNCFVPNVTNIVMSDEVKCGVCLGTHFKCEDCADLLLIKARATDPQLPQLRYDICPDCMEYHIDEEDGCYVQ